MKKRIFKIASLLLAFTVLFSTLSFSVNQHYCGKMLFSKSYLFHSQDCGMANMDLSDTGNPFFDSMKNNDCHNIKIYIQGQNIEQKALISKNLDVQKMALVFYFNVFDFEKTFQKQPAFYQNYSPPLLVRNIPVLVQAFRI